MKIDEEKRTNRRLLSLSVGVWVPISALLFVRLCMVNRPDVFLMISFALVAPVFGVIVTFIIFSIPFRVFQNLTQPERRTVRLWETAWCIVAFLSVVYVVILAIITYPPDY